MDILKIGKSSYKSTYGIIDLSWWPIISSVSSVLAILFGSIWIYKPVSDKTNKWIGYLTFLPIFFFRLLSWQIIIITSVELSFVVLGVALVLNAASFYLIQGEKLFIEPLNSALLSLVLPTYKLPSTVVDDTFSMKALAALVTIGNTVLLTALSFIFGLHSMKLYDPWDPANDWPILFEERWFQIAFFSLLTLYFAATLPTLLLYLLSSIR
jgi:hypothetical protein